MKWKRMIWIMILNTNKNTTFFHWRTPQEQFTLLYKTSKRKNSFLGGFEPFLQFFGGIFVIFF